MRSRLILVLLLVVTVATPGEGATLLPLEAEDAALLPPGRLELVGGAEMLRGFRPPFLDVERDQWSAPWIGIHAGLGTRAEAQFRWEALAVNDEATEQEFAYSRWDVGDARLSTKIRVFRAGDYGIGLPDTALHFGLKLPNASRPKRMGTDEADFFGGGLISRDVPGGRLHLNLGIAVLGNPGAVRGQDDLFLYRVAAESLGVAHAGEALVRLYAEVGGSAGSRFDNDRNAARVGVRLAGDRLATYLAGSVGFDENAEEFGVRFGLVCWLQAFEE
jgi:hypothetical protein